MVSKHDSKDETSKPLEIKGSLLARNTLLNLIGQGLPLIVAVVTIPFIIQGLGIERFGLLSLAWVVLDFTHDILPCKKYSGVNLWKQRDRR